MAPTLDINATSLAIANSLVTFSPRRPPSPVTYTVGETSAATLYAASTRAAMEERALMETAERNVRDRNRRYETLARMEREERARVEEELRARERANMRRRERSRSRGRERRDSGYAGEDRDRRVVVVMEREGSLVRRGGAEERVMVRVESSGGGRGGRRGSIRYIDGV